MKKLILVMALLMSTSCVKAESSEVIVEGPKEAVSKSFRRPAQLCINGVVYYVARETRVSGPQAAGYGFFAPKVDNLTLQFVRCRKENNKVIQEI